MKASELKAGRTFGVTFQHGDEFMPSLAASAARTTSGRATSPCSSPDSPRPTSLAPARS